MLPDILAGKSLIRAAISINSSSQIIAGLTAAMLIKKTAGQKCLLAGISLAGLQTLYIKKPAFFKTFCDYLLVDEGEKPILEYAKFIAGEIEAEKVPNMLYLQDGKVIMNEKASPMPLNEMKPLNLDGFELDRYLTPDIVLSVQASRGVIGKMLFFAIMILGISSMLKMLITL
ncbi:MAG: hypothetical protein MZU97_02585 [Bacillus subtilis]|nr:hypothetical protein [Bacillus subtilis]